MCTQMKGRFRRILSNQTVLIVLFFSSLVSMSICLCYITSAFFFCLFHSYKQDTTTRYFQKRCLRRYNAAFQTSPARGIEQASTAAIHRHASGYLRCSPFRFRLNLPESLEDGSKQQSLLKKNRFC